MFGPNKSSASFKSSRVVLTDICNSFGNHDCACHSGVTKIRVACSDSFLFNTRAISENVENAYPFRCVQEILDASLPLLEGSGFHDMYVATW